MNPQHPRVRPADALRHVVAPVAILTASVAGRRHGMTTSEFSTIAGDTSAVAVSLPDASKTLGAVLALGRFRLNVLATGTEATAAAWTGGDGEFGEAEWDVAADAGPALRHAMTRLVCEVAHRFVLGDRAVLIAEVTDAEVLASRLPLLRLDGADRRVEELPVPVFARFRPTAHPQESTVNDR